MKIIIVDDHEVVREGLIAALSRDQRFEFVAAVGTGREALAVAVMARPDIAIVDLRLPDLVGDEVCRRLRAAVPSIKIVVLSTYLSEGSIRDAYAAGANAYVTKTAGLAKLRETLVELSQAASNAPPDISHASNVAQQLHALVDTRMVAQPTTPQQRSILELAARGLTNEQIGRRLSISESTVRYHIQRLKIAFAARTRTELIAKAVRTGVIELEHEHVLASAVGSDS
jgi:DNA-binding NarL/FixJ family response regulator